MVPKFQPARMAWLLSACLVAVPIALPIAGEAAAEPPAIDRSVRTATHTGPVRLPDADPTPTVRFSQLPARVGDRVAQEVRVELNLTTTITQSGQVAHQGTNSMERQQHRGIEVLEVADNRVRRAEVAYRTCRQVLREGKPENGLPETKSMPQPVEGKSYFVTRNGRKLVITDTEGNIPPLEEFKIVSENMQTLGQPSPLAKYLLGREFTVGDWVALPKRIAEQLLGLGDPFGKVHAFELQLLGIEVIDGQRCARFAAKIQAVASEQGQISLDLAGHVVIQIATCRTVNAELAGLVNMSSEEKTWRGSFQYAAEGGMKVSIHSTYAQAK